MHGVLTRRLLYPSRTHRTAVLPEVPSFLVPGRSSCSMQIYLASNNRDEELQILLKTLLTKEPPLLSAFTELSRYYYNQSSEICQKYYEENVAVTIDKALAICINSVNQSCLEWNRERQKRITGSSCSLLYKYCKSVNPNWEKKLNFAYKAKDFPLYLTQATSHGLCHQKAAQRRYVERMKGYSVLDLGLVIHPQVPFVGFSPDGIILNSDGKPEGLIEIKCPLDGRVFSSEDLLRLASYFDENGLIKSNYKYYGQIQLGMFILGLPYCDFILYSSSENDYTRKRINFDELFVQEMMGNLVKVYFKNMLPWLTRKNLGTNKRKRT